jgi:hypothetical protein
MMPPAKYLPADAFAHQVLLVLAETKMTLPAFADSIDVQPHWLIRVLAGEIIELPLLTVLGICRRLRLMPEDIWDPGLVAHTFSGWPGRAFLDEHEE